MNILLWIVVLMPSFCMAVLNETMFTDVANRIAASVGNGRIGESLDMKGFNAVIGAPDAEEDLLETAVVLRRETPDWIVAALIRPKDRSSSSSSVERRFGSSVAITTSWIVVGTEQDSDGGNFAGAVYVFRRADASDAWGGLGSSRGGPAWRHWAQARKVVDADAEAFDRFGRRVIATETFSGGVTYGRLSFVVGVPNHNAGRGRVVSCLVETAAPPVNEADRQLSVFTSMGAGDVPAYSFRVESQVEETVDGNVCVEGEDRQELSSPHPVVDGAFGDAIAMAPSGRLLVVGAPGEAGETGRVYVYNRTIQEPFPESQSGVANGGLGGLVREEAAELFERNGTKSFVAPSAWTLVAELTVSGVGGTTRRFGRAVAVSETFVAISGQENIGGSTWRGFVELHRLAFAEPSEQYLNATKSASITSVPSGQTALGSLHPILSGAFSLTLERVVRPPVSSDFDPEQSTPALATISTDGKTSFGASLRISSTHLAVGAPRDGSGGIADRGTVAIYRAMTSLGDEETFTPRALVRHTWESGETQDIKFLEGARLGSSLAMSPSEFLVGAPFASGLQGRVYSYNSFLLFPILAPTISPNSGSFFTITPIEVIVETNLPRERAYATFDNSAPNPNTLPLPSPFNPSGGDDDDAVSGGGGGVLYINPPVNGTTQVTIRAIASNAFEAGSRSPESTATFFVSSPTPGLYWSDQDLVLYDCGNVSVYCPGEFLPYNIRPVDIASYSAPRSVSETQRQYQTLCEPNAYCIGGRRYECGRDICWPLVERMEAREAVMGERGPLGEDYFETRRPGINPGDVIDVYFDEDTNQRNLANDSTLVQNLLQFSTLPASGMITTWISSRHLRLQITNGSWYMPTKDPAKSTAALLALDGALTSQLSTDGELRRSQDSTQFAFMTSAVSVSGTWGDFPPPDVLFAEAMAGEHSDSQPDFTPGASDKLLVVFASPPETVDVSNVSSLLEFRPELDPSTNMSAEWTSAYCSRYQDRTTSCYPALVILFGDAPARVKPRFDAISDGTRASGLRDQVAFDPWLGIDRDQYNWTDYAVENLMVRVRQSAQLVSADHSSRPANENGTTPFVHLNGTWGDVLRGVDLVRHSDSCAVLHLAMPQHINSANPENIQCEIGLADPPTTVHLAQQTSPGSFVWGSTGLDIQFNIGLDPNWAATRPSSAGPYLKERSGTLDSIKVFASQRFVDGMLQNPSYLLEANISLATSISPVFGASYASLASDIGSLYPTERALRVCGLSTGTVIEARCRIHSTPLHESRLGFETGPWMHAFPPGGLVLAPLLLGPLEDQRSAWLHSSGRSLRTDGLVNISLVHTIGHGRHARALDVDVTLASDSRQKLCSCRFDLYGNALLCAVDAGAGKNFIPSITLQDISTTTTGIHGCNFRDGVLGLALQPNNSATPKCPIISHLPPHIISFEPSTGGCAAKLDDANPTSTEKDATFSGHLDPQPSCPVTIEALESRVYSSSIYESGFEQSPDNSSQTIFPTLQDALDSSPSPYPYTFDIVGSGLGANDEDIDHVQIQFGSSPQTTNATCKIVSTGSRIQCSASSPPTGGVTNVSLLIGGQPSTSFPLPLPNIADPILSQVFVIDTEQVVPDSTTLYNLLFHPSITRRQSILKTILTSNPLPSSTNTAVSTSGGFSIFFCVGSNLGDELSQHHTTLRYAPRAGAKPAPYSLPPQSSNSISKPLDTQPHWSSNDAPLFGNGSYVTTSFPSATPQKSESPLCVSISPNRILACLSDDGVGAFLAFQLQIGSKLSNILETDLHHWRPLLSPLSRIRVEEDIFSSPLHAPLLQPIARRSVRHRNGTAWDPRLPWDEVPERSFVPTLAEATFVTTCDILNPSDESAVQSFLDAAQSALEARTSMWPPLTPSNGTFATEIAGAPTLEDVETAWANLGSSLGGVHKVEMWVDALNALDARIALTRGVVPRGYPRTSSEGNGWVDYRGGVVWLANESVLNPPLSNPEAYSSISHGVLSTSADSFLRDDPQLYNVDLETSTTSSILSRHTPIRYLNNSIVSPQPACRIWPEPLIHVPLTESWVVLGGSDLGIQAAHRSMAEIEAYLDGVRLSTSQVKFHADGLLEVLLPGGATRRRLQLRVNGRWSNGVVFVNAAPRLHGILEYRVEYPDAEDEEGVELSAPETWGGPGAWEVADKCTRVIVSGFHFGTSEASLTLYADWSIGRECSSLSNVRDHRVICCSKASSGTMVGWLGGQRSQDFLFSSDSIVRLPTLSSISPEYVSTQGLGDHLISGSNLLPGDFDNIPSVHWSGDQIVLVASPLGTEAITPDGQEPQVYTFNTQHQFVDDPTKGLAAALGRGQDPFEPNFGELPYLDSTPNLPSPWRAAVAPDFAWSPPADKTSVCASQLENHHLVYTANCTEILELFNTTPSTLSITSDALLARRSSPNATWLEAPPFYRVRPFEIPLQSATATTVRFTSPDTHGSGFKLSVLVATMVERGFMQARHVATDNPYIWLPTIPPVVHSVHPYQLPFLGGVVTLRGTNFGVGGRVFLRQRRRFITSATNARLGGTVPPDATLALISEAARSEDYWGNWLVSSGLPYPPPSGMPIQVARELVARGSLSTETPLAPVLAVHPYFLARGIDARRIIEGLDDSAELLRDREPSVGPFVYSECRLLAWNDTEIECLAPPGIDNETSVIVSVGWGVSAPFQGLEYHAEVPCFANSTFTGDPVDLNTPTLLEQIGTGVWLGAFFTVIVLVIIGCIFSRIFCNKCGWGHHSSGLSTNATPPPSGEADLDDHALAVSVRAAASVRDVHTNALLHGPDPSSPKHPRNSKEMRLRDLYEQRKSANPQEDSSTQKRFRKTRHRPIVQPKVPPGFSETDFRSIFRQAANTQGRDGRPDDFVRILREEGLNDADFEKQIAGAVTAVETQEKE